MRNICKFILDTPPDKLEISCFVSESIPEVMREPSLLSQHRAILVTQGEGKFRFDDTRIPFRPGQLVFGLKGEEFSVELDGFVEYMYINFDGSRAEELLRRFDIRLNRRSFDGFDGLIPFWQDSLSRASEVTMDLAFESTLLYTFSRMTAASPERNDLVNKIVELSEEHFTDPDLTVSAAARKLGYNAKYISHVFKEKMGVTYSEYLRTLRIKFAVSLFDHGIDSVKNAALLSGFTDPLYFSTVFKKNIGLSPKEYKNRIAKRENQE